MHTRVFVRGFVNLSPRFREALLFLQKENAERAFSTF